MDAGSLVLANSIAPNMEAQSVQNTNGESQQAANSKGFNKLFKSMLAHEQSDTETASVDNETVPLESMKLSEEQKEEIGQLLQFFENQDSFDLDDLEDCFLEADNLLASLLGSDTFDLKETLLKLMEGNDETNIAIDLQPILNYLNQLTSLPTSEFVETVNGEDMALMKLMKIYDYFTAQQNTQDKGAFNDLLTRLQDKMENLLNNGSALVGNNNLKDDSRLTYLQNKFSQLAAELTSNGNKVSAATGSKLNEQSSSNEKLQSFSGFAQLQQMSKAEQLTLLSQNGKPVSAEQLMRQFENILSKSQFSNVGGTQKLLIKLYPEHLGSLRIELTQKDGGIVAKMLASTQAAKDLLESQVQGLKQAFASQNIQVDKIEISQQWNQQQDHFLNKEGERHNQRNPQQNHQSSNKGEDEETFSFTLEDALVNMEV